MAKSILVVDYDPKRVEGTTRAFSEAGFEVEVARDGVAGVEAFARLHPNVVLVEMMLPKRHGFEVCQELRKLRPDNRTPILILGSTQAERYRLQAISAGANDYLVRPVPGDRLLEICLGLLGEPNQDLPAVPPDSESPLEDSFADFFEDPAREKPDSAPDDFLESFTQDSPNANEPPPAVDLGDLTDDDIMARLDALLPSEPVSACQAPAPAKTEPPAQTAKQPAGPVPEAPEPSAHEAPRPRTPLPAPDRAVPRAKLPQTSPVSEPSPRVAVASRGNGLWPIAAVIAAVTLVAGFYVWRAVQPDGGDLSETTILDPGDFAQFRSELAPTAATAYPGESATGPAQPLSEEPGTEMSGGSVVTTGAVDSAESAEPSLPPTPPRVSPSSSKRERSSVDAEQAPPPDSSPVPEPRATQKPEPVSPPRETLQPATAASSLPAVPTAEPLGLTRVVPDAPMTVPESKTEPEIRIAPGSIVDLSDVDAPPVAVSRSAPKYPPLALRMRREGTVKIRILVDEDGRVADAAPVDATSPRDFAGAAVEAARDWRYRPAQKDGVAVKVWITEVVGFKM